MARSPDLIIDKIQNIRTKNNVLWMDILRIAFRTDPEESKKIFLQITGNDTEITKLCRELTE